MHAYVHIHVHVVVGENYIVTCTCITCYFVEWRIVIAHIHVVLHVRTYMYMCLNYTDMCLTSCIESSPHQCQRLHTDYIHVHVHGIPHDQCRTLPAHVCIIMAPIISQPKQMYVFVLGLCIYVHVPCTYVCSVITGHNG